MNRFLNGLTLGGLVIVGVLGAATASAQCAPPDAQVEIQKQSWHGATGVRPMQVGWRHHDDDIVGYWNIVVSSKGNPGIPDGTVLDRGLQQWHDDGTEFLNSSSQHPATQNYCMGTWEQTGPYTYKLNHFAYSYDINQNVTGLVRIREIVKLSLDGSEQTGTQTVDIYDTARNHLATLAGTLVGKRITIDTTAQDVR
jgi:hypothetical protein